MDILITAKRHWRKILLAAAVLAAGWVIAVGNGDATANETPPAEPGIAVAPADSTQPDPDPSWDRPKEHGAEDDAHDPEVYVEGSASAPESAAIASARSFAKRFCRRDISQDQWLDEIKRGITTDYARALGVHDPEVGVDPGNIPCSAVGNRVKVVRSTADRLIADIETTEGNLRVVTVTLVGDWFVTNSEWMGGR